MGWWGQQTASTCSSMSVDLHTIWFLTFSLLLAGYVIFDGAILGLGMLYPLVREDRHRRALVHSMGSGWNRNELWLVLALAAAALAFPHFCRVLVSAWGPVWLLLIAAVLFRDAAGLVRHRSAHPGICRVCDALIPVSSTAASLSLGFMIGNLIWGMPLDQTGEVVALPGSRFNLFALLGSVTMVALLLMHGTMYITLTTRGSVRNQFALWLPNTIIAFVIFYAILTMATLVFAPHMSDRFKDFPMLFSLPVLTLLSIANIPRAVHRAKPGWAFCSSSLAILGLAGLYAVGSLPVLLLSTLDYEFSLTLYNAAAPDPVLKRLLLVALPALLALFVYSTRMLYYTCATVSGKPGFGPAAETAV